MGWNTQANGSGTGYSASGTDTFTIGANTTMYAQWLEDSIGDSLEKKVSSTAESYTVGSLVSYNLSYTLPDDISIIKTISLVDTYVPALTYSSYTMTVGGVAVTPTFNHDAVGRELTFALTEAQIAGREGQVISVILTFTVTSTADSIVNNVGLFINDYKVGEDDETLYKVLYNGNGSTGGTTPVDANVYREGASVTVLANTGNLVRTGFIYVGWNTQANGSGDGYAGTGTETFVIDENLTMYAQWLSDDIGDSLEKTVSSAAMSYSVGDLVEYTIRYTLPADVGVIRTLTFKDIYTDALTYGSYTMLIGGTTVTPAFDHDTANRTLSFTLNNAGLVGNEGSQIVLRIIFTIANAAEAITNNVDLLINDYDVGDDEVTLYKVKYDGNGNTGGTAPVDGNVYRLGASVTVRANTGNLVRTGFAFVGWNTQANGSGDYYAATGTASFAMVDNVTLYAQWVDDTFGDDMLKEVTSTADSYAVGDSVEYTITFTLPTEVSAIDTIEIEDNYTTALNYMSYTMTIGGAAVTPTFNNDTVARVLTFTLTGAQVAGRAGQVVSLTSTYSVANTGTYITNNVSLYVNGYKTGEDEETLYKVLYNGNGQTGGTAPVDPLVYKYGAMVRVYANVGNLYRINSNLASWNTMADSSGTNYATTGTAIFFIPGNMTLYARWSLINSPPIGGGEGEVNPRPITPNEPPFDYIPDDDVPIGPFISEHVAYIIGYPDGTVKPENNVTRAEVATVYYRLLRDDVRSDNWAENNSMTDIPQARWCNIAVSVMSRMEILEGYPDGTFRPDNAISRAELATIAARFARISGTGGAGGGETTSHRDVEGHWAQRDISFAARTGLLIGYPDGTFKPDQPITRAEFVTLVNRMLKRVPESLDDLLPGQMASWPDNTNQDTWYYVAMQEASNSHSHGYKTARTVPDLDFEYEYWVAMIANRDWIALERGWASARGR